MLRTETSLTLGCTDAPLRRSYTRGRGPFVAAHTVPLTAPIAHTAPLPIANVRPVTRYLSNTHSLSNIHTLSNTHSLSNAPFDEISVHASKRIVDGADYSALSRTVSVVPMAAYDEVPLTYAPSLHSQRSYVIGPLAHQPATASASAQATRSYHPLSTAPTSSYPQAYTYPIIQSTATRGLHPSISYTSPSFVTSPPQSYLITPSTAANTTTNQPPHHPISASPAFQNYPSTSVGISGLSRSITLTPSASIANSAPQQIPLQSSFPLVVTHQRILTAPTNPFIIAYSSPAKPQQHHTTPQPLEKVVSPKASDQPTRQTVLRGPSFSDLASQTDVLYQTDERDSTHSYDENESLVQEGSVHGGSQCSDHDINTRVHEYADGSDTRGASQIGLETVDAQLADSLTRHLAVQQLDPYVSPRYDAPNTIVVTDDVGRLKEEEKKRQEEEKKKQEEEKKRQEEEKKKQGGKMSLSPRQHPQALQYKSVMPRRFSPTLITP
eukprot:TRINITY_DN4735_c0_g1_i4.p1 TRINITY_DN4735_c0_g1~~TRINITY_DN4735_c0_g1_i4.p1  ORF type:complete len:495 (-),score=92.19 TRINITY_DN4735_c0_g1_i4:40-1524(-)